MTFGAAIGWLIALGLAQFLPDIDPRVAALVGMFAMFAGASRALLASVVFGIEATQQIHAIVPIVSGVTLAFVASAIRWYRELIAKKYDGTSQRQGGRPGTATSLQRSLREVRAPFTFLGPGHHDDWQSGRQWLPTTILAQGCLTRVNTFRNTPKTWSIRRQRIKEPCSERAQRSSQKPKEWQMNSSLVTKIGLASLAAALTGFALESVSEAANDAFPVTLQHEKISFVPCSSEEPSSSQCLSITGTGLSGDGSGSVTETRNVTLKEYGTSSVTGCSGSAITSGTLEFSNGKSYGFSGSGTYCKSEEGTRVAGSAYYDSVTVAGSSQPTWYISVSAPSFEADGSVTDTALVLMH